jgi:hypothetical protein
MMMTRDEHLQRAKQRALKYWEAGHYVHAVTSMMSDLSKHPELKNHAGLQIGAMWFVSPAMHKDREFVHKFIVGFN